MFAKSSKKTAAVYHKTCNVLMIVLAVLSTLSTIAALVGVYKAHFLSTGLTFGTLNDSASLIALALNLFLMKKVCSMCACQYQGVKK